MTVIRDSFLFRVSFGSRLATPDLLKQLHEQLAVHEKRLADLQQNVRSRVSHITGEHWPDEQPFWELTLERAINYEKGYIEFCQTAIDRLQPTSQ
ncbi:MAG: hypothetical protein WEB00_03305 [Dehalococcoidia bacterium]